MKKFRKGISALMALVIMLSCISIMNVSVYAAKSNGYGFYDFGGAAESLIQTSDYTSLVITSGDGITQGSHKFKDLTFVSDSSARVYWGQAAQNVAGTDYTGYFYTNGQRTPGNTGRILQIEVDKDDIITVVSNAEADNYGLEIYNSAKTTDKYDTGAVLPASGNVSKFIAPSEGTYNINAYSQKARIFRVGVSAPLKVVPTYKLGNDGTLSSGTVKVNGTEYDWNAELTLIPNDEYKVICKSGGKTYKGTFTATGQSIEVNLTETNYTSISLDFMNGNIISDTGSNNTYYIKDSVASTSTSQDYDVKIESVKSHNSGYGIVSNGAVTIEFRNVVGPAVITIGTNDYGELLTAETTGSGEFAAKSGIVTKELNTKGSKYADSSANVATLYYSGTDTAKITLKSTNQIYIPYIGVETIEEDELPELIYANTGVKLTVNGAKEGDIVILTDSAKNEYNAKIGAGNIADFSGNNVMVGNATVEVLGYTVAPESINIALEQTEYTVTATASGGSVPAASDTSALYVGYKPTDTYKVYTNIQAAVDAASPGDTIKIADGTYHEVNGVKVDKDNITIESVSGDKKKVIIWDDEHEQSVSPRGFHGDTLIVNGKGFVANNITIMNNAEEEKKIPDAASHGNATALGINPKKEAASGSASATFNGCSILATRDTIFTGSVAQDELTFNNCLITGFQDVVCGAGKVTLNDCEMDPSLGVKDTYFTKSTARLFAPREKGSVFTANNLTISSTGNGESPIYFARAWDSTREERDYTVIINGYTISANATNAFNAALNGGYYGFDPNGISQTDLTKEFFWLVRKTKDEGNYNTTLDKFNSVPANAIETTMTKNDTDAYKFVGKINSSLIEDTDVDKIGFALYDSNDEFKGNIFDSVVYPNKEDMPDNYYSLNYVTNIVDTTVKAKPYVHYKEYDIEGKTVDTVSITQ